MSRDKDKELRPIPYQKAQEAYDKIPDHFKENLLAALLWATGKLARHEGTGHNFEIAYDKKSEGFIACFSKPEWNADHASQPMPTAQEAIVMAVCEYLNGV